MLTTGSNINAQNADSLSTDTIFKDISLQELVVKASRIKEKANGFTMNIIDKKMVRGKSVSQMMGFLPNISTDSNGRISIYNQSPSAIYIDGVRLMSLQELKNIPAERIRKIDVDYFNNGSESATSNGGIINIWLKHEKGAYQSTTVGTLTNRPWRGGHQEKNYMKACRSAWADLLYITAQTFTTATGKTGIRNTE